MHILANQGTAAPSARTFNLFYYFSLGYFGVVKMALIDYLCPVVQGTADDLNAERIAARNDPDLMRLLMHEPGLDAVVGQKLHFCTNVEPAIVAPAGVYGQWLPAERSVTMSLRKSKLSRLTGSAFLAQWISSINGIAAFCEATGADVREVGRTILTYSRIGPKFLHAGPSFSGSCCQKEIINLVYLCRHYGHEEVAAYWEQVMTEMFCTQTEKRIGVLGFAFKADTKDTRESPAIRIFRDLKEQGAVQQILDPKESDRQIALNLCQPPADEGQNGDQKSWPGGLRPIASKQLLVPTMGFCSSGGNSSLHRNHRRWSRRYVKRPGWSTSRLRRHSSGTG
jgi:hypothetical protein